MDDKPTISHAWSAKVIAIEEEGNQLAFVSLGDLEQITDEDPARLRAALRQPRTVFESWEDRSAGVFVRKPEP